MTEPITIEQFIRTKYPPDENDPFYQQWGYEQWLIKTYKYNIEQLVCLERKTYNQYRLALVIAGNGLEHYLHGRPLVRSCHILSGYFMESVPKGSVGVSLWQEESGEHFCLFPCRKGSIFGPLMRQFRDGEIEVLNTTYKSEQQVLEMCAKDRPSYVHDLKRQFVDIPGLGIVYVTKTWSGDYSGTYCTIEYVPAVPAKTKPWKRAPNAKKIRHTIKKHQLEEATILWQ